MVLMRVMNVNDNDEKDDESDDGVQDRSQWKAAGT